MKVDLNQLFRQQKLVLFEVHFHYYTILQMINNLN